MNKWNYLIHMREVARNITLFILPLKERYDKESILLHGHICVKILLFYNF